MYYQIRSMTLQEEHHMHSRDVLGNFPGLSDMKMHYSPMVSALAKIAVSHYRLNRRLRCLMDMIYQPGLKLRMFKGKKSNRQRYLR